MEKLEIIITVLLLCLVALGVYVATSWTLAWKKKKEDGGGREEVPYRYLEDEAENARKKVATAYAQETMPKITITPVQPRPDFPRVRDMIHDNVFLLTCVADARAIIGCELEWLDRAVKCVSAPRAYSRSRALLPLAPY